VHAHPVPDPTPPGRPRVPRELLVVLLGTLLVVGVLLLPDLVPPPDDGTPPVVALHGRIVSIAAPDADQVAVGAPPVPTARVLILEGERAGETLDAQIEGPGGSQLIGDYKPGDEVVVSITRSADEAEPYVAVADRWRVVPVALLVGLFALAVVVVGGWRGARALVALGLTIAIILKVLLPLIIRGVPPLPLAVVAATAITAITILLTEGRSRASLAAILGTSASLAIAGLLAAAATAAASFTFSAGSDLAFLVSIGGSGLDLRGVLLAAMLLGAVGVLDDVTVTQAVVVDELSASGGLRGRALFLRAHEIGRSHIGATVNTLFLAYAGASLPLLVVLLVSHPPAALVTNSEEIATEIVRTLAGSLGIVAAVPLTTFIATALVDARSRAAGEAGASAAGTRTAWSWPVAAIAVAVVLLLGATAVLPSTQGARAPLPTEVPFEPQGSDPGLGGQATPDTGAVFPTDSPEGRQPALAEIGYPAPVSIGTQTVGTATVEDATVTGKRPSIITVNARYDAIGAWPLDPGAWEILTADGVEIPLAADPAIDGTLEAGDGLDVTLSASTRRKLDGAFIAYKDSPETFLFLVPLD
jgi:uncharacterized membrane protein